MVYMLINGVLVLLSAILVAYMEVSDTITINGRLTCSIISPLLLVREFPKSNVT